MTSHPRPPSDEHTQDCECRGCQPAIPVEDMRRELGALKKDCPIAWYATATDGYRHPSKCTCGCTGEVPLIPGLREALAVASYGGTIAWRYSEGADPDFQALSEAAYTVACIEWLNITVDDFTLVAEDYGEWALHGSITKSKLLSVQDEPLHTAVVRATWLVAQSLTTPAEQGQEGISKP